MPKNGKAKKYGARFADDMANDPNMGMNPRWRKANGLSMNPFPLGGGTPKGKKRK